MGHLQTRLSIFAGIALLGCSVIQPARAQDADDQKQGVARISLMNGEVSVRRGDSGEWVAGVINAPLLTDDRVSTGPNSRAEIQFDAANILRIGGNAEVRLADLEYNRFQVEMAKGTATFRVLRATGANVEVDTPSVSVRPSKVGIFRIAVSESGETEVMSRAGDLEVFTPRGSQWINAGQMMVARGTTADPEFQIVGMRPIDEWDHWNEDRDRHFTQSQSYQYVDPSTSGIYGTEELDGNGTWVNAPEYGQVWRPTVGADWAPYRSGRWVWEDWYGWTWVSADSWGWAPYHYGRWFNNAGFGWCWYPGARGFHHYWSPALVAWFGYGGGGGFGFGFGNVGWVPLAPFETFHPWWGRGFYGREGFMRNVNVTNVNITNVYRNARINGGVSGMAAGDFRGGRFSSIGRVSGEQVRSAGLVRGQMPIAPTSANMHFANRSASFTPRTNENTRFFSHQQPAGAARTPLNQQATGGAVRPQGSNPGQSVQAARPAQNGPAASAGSGGWRRFGEPAPRTSGNVGGTAPSQSNLNNTRPSQAPAGNGWQRFGSPSGGAQRSGTPNNTRTESAPQQRYSAPQQQQQQRSAPSYSAPRNAGGGGGNTRPSGGGGNSHPSTGGNSRGHR